MTITTSEQAELEALRADRDQLRMLLADVLEIVDWVYERQYCRGLRNGFSLGKIPAPLRYQEILDAHEYPRPKSLRALSEARAALKTK